MNKITIFILLLHVVLQYTFTHSIQNIKLCPHFQYYGDNTNFTNTTKLTLPKYFISPVFLDQNLTEIKFNLKHAFDKREFKCPDSSSFTVELNLDMTGDSKNLGKAIHFTPSGYIQHYKDIYSSEEYCIEIITVEKIVVRLCRESCEDGEEEGEAICIPKCCAFGHILNVTDGEGITCVYSENQELLSPQIYSNSYTRSMKNPIQHIYIHGPKDWCKSDDIKINSNKEHEEPFRLLEDGTSVAKTSRLKWETIQHGQFCVDYLQDEEDWLDFIMFSCSEKLIDYDGPPHRFLYGGGFYLSATCLAITIGINYLIMDAKDSYRWPLLVYFLSFFFLQISQGSGHLFPYFTGEAISEPGTIARKICFGIAVASHFFNLTTFYWLGAVNVDIWWTFRDVRIRSKRSNKVFLIHVGLSLLSSVTIITIALILDNLYGNDINSKIIVPEYGKTSCFLEPTYASLYYLWLPVGFLLLLNTCLFIWTVSNIIEAKKGTAIATSAKNSRKEREKFLFLKLFLIMGIPWLFELVSWSFTNDYYEIPWYFMIFDILVILQGVAIFYLFCLAPTPRANLFGKYPKFKKFLDSAHEATIC